MSDKTRTAFGIPLTGEEPYFARRGRGEQKPLSDLEPLIRAALDDPAIDALNWKQYTPYFNDGDECVFSAYGVGVKLHGDLPEDVDLDDFDSEDGFIETYELKYSKDALQLSDETFSRVYPTVQALEQAIGGGQFNDALYEEFGDHCTVSVYPDRIVLESYEHD